MKAPQERKNQLWESPRNGDNSSIPTLWSRVRPHFPAALVGGWDNMTEFQPVECVQERVADTFPTKVHPTESSVLFLSFPTRTEQDKTLDNRKKTTHWKKLGFEWLWWSGFCLPPSLKHWCTLPVTLVRDKCSPLSHSNLELFVITVSVNLINTLQHLEDTVARSYLWQTTKPFLSLTSHFSPHPALQPGEVRGWLGVGQGREEPGRKIRSSQLCPLPYCRFPTCGCGEVASLNRIGIWQF